MSESVGLSPDSDSLSFAENLGFEILEFNPSKKAYTTVRCKVCDTRKQIRWVIWKCMAKKRGGKTCATCSMRARSRSPEEVGGLVTTSGLQLESTLGSGTISQFKKFWVTCSVGHRFETCASYIKADKSCPSCARESSLRPPQELILRLEAEGYTLSAYTGYRGHVSIRCPKGHQTENVWNRLILDGSKCVVCTREENRFSLQELIEQMLLDGLTLQTVVPPGTLLNRLSTLKWRCAQGHEFETRAWNSLNGSRCRKCSFLQTGWEKQLAEYFGRSGIPFEANNREVIKPYELDFLFPSFSVALELCGNRFHNDRRQGRGKEYHLMKHSLAVASGVRLITIFEHEWNGVPSDIDLYLEVPDFEENLRVESKQDVTQFFGTSGLVAEVVFNESLLGGPPLLDILWKSRHVRIKDLLLAVPRPFVWIEESRLFSVPQTKGLYTVFDATDRPNAIYTRKDVLIRSVDRTNPNLDSLQYTLWGCGFKVLSNVYPVEWAPEPELVEDVAYYVIPSESERPHWLDFAVNKLEATGRSVRVLTEESLLSRGIGKAHQRSVKESTAPEDRARLGDEIFFADISEYTLSREEWAAEHRLFCLRYEWLGSLGNLPKWVFTARVRGELACLVCLNPPTASSKLLGLGTDKLECLIQRGASASFCHPHVGSKLIRFACTWMVKNTEKRVFYGYADPLGGEIGTIYQASGFEFLGFRFGAKKMYVHPTFKKGKPFSSQSLKRTSLWKVWHRQWFGTPMPKEWFGDSGFKRISNIPPEMVRLFYDNGRRIISESESVEVPAKGKYVLVLGADRREQKLLDSRKQYKPVLPPKREKPV